MPFIPHTKNDILNMLQTIGIQSTEELFDEIPKNLLVESLPGMREGESEMALNRSMRHLAELDTYRLNFMGAGAYEHHIPAAVWEVASRGEWMTAYTPYQAEASQGTLQLLYEYQTMMANLMGMEVSNASLYDGASALAEALLMAIRVQATPKAKSTRSHHGLSPTATHQYRVLLPTTLHPYYRQVVKTIVQAFPIEIIEIPFQSETGTISLESLAEYQNESISILVIAQPNFFGGLEDVDALTDWGHQQNAVVIGVVNPIAMAWLKPPGVWGKTGVDIACGEGQPLGVPLASGGPYFGFLCCKKSIIRQLPGRLIGRTKDQEGKEGFALTLQAREQHIRRSKATSNICTNQGLLVTAATIYMSMMGAEGLQRVAKKSHHNTRLLLEKLVSIPGVKRIFNGPFFHEIVLQIPTLESVLSKLANMGILAGVSLQHTFPEFNAYPELKDCVLICATETKTPEDMLEFSSALRTALTEGN